MYDLDATHDPALRSWVASANVTGGDFPIQNLPFGRWRHDGEVRCGVAIGDAVIDLGALAATDGLDPETKSVAAAIGDDLSVLLAAGRGPARSLRHALSRLLAEGAGQNLRDNPKVLVAQAEVELLAPTTVRSFSDMCVSTFHIGRRHGNDDRGQPICPPVFRTLPVGYDGRASSVVISGTPVRRPNGQWLDRWGGGGKLAFGPEPRQDYELEMGAWIGGTSNAQGEMIDLATAEQRLFGLCLLNDWSARGIQMWETMLGPFLGKSIATSISPWIITFDALAPFRTAAFQRPAGDPVVPVHLLSKQDQAMGGLDIKLTATLQSALMEDTGTVPVEICSTNFRHMYWTWVQMVAHHASNGCSLAAGDLIGSGTCSGREFSAAACLAERMVGDPIQLPDGSERTWLADGDRVSLQGRAERDGFVGIGFGEVTGVITPAQAWP